MKIDHQKLNRIGQYICENGYKLALAESMSAGFFASVWSLQCDSGNFFEGGIVCFSERIKNRLLDVPESMIRRFSAESIEVTEAMLNGLKKQIDADLYLAITGVAYRGADRQPSQPGDVYFALDFSGYTMRRKVRLKPGNAGEVYIRSFNQSLALIEELLEINAGGKTLEK